MKPAVVVCAHDRPEALARLLASVAAAEVAPGTPLVISVDGGGTRSDSVRCVAHGASWPHGPVEVIERDQLGLVAHHRACGDLVDDLGAIVLLEDDLVVGPWFLEFAAAALEATVDDDRIAGISLSAPRFDGFRHLPFEPLLDGSDGVYARVPWFHGMAWTPTQWRSHRSGAGVDRSVALPAAYDALDGDDAEWFPDHVRALVATDRWYLLSRHAHAVNFGDPGVHFDRATDVFQQPLVGGSLGPPRLAALGDDGGAPRYDEYMEIDPRWLLARAPELPADLTVDLRAVRDLDSVSTEWMLTTRPSRRVERSWGAAMHPLEQNVLSDVAGADIVLSTVADVERGPRSDRTAAARVARHASHGRSPGLRAALAQAASASVAAAGATARRVRERRTRR